MYRVAKQNFSHEEGRFASLGLHYAEVKLIWDYQIGYQETNFSPST